MQVHCLIIYGLSYIQEFLRISGRQWLLKHGFSNRCLQDQFSTGSSCMSKMWSCFYGLRRVISLSKWFYDTSIGTAIRTARCGSLLKGLRLSYEQLDEHEVYVVWTVRA
jgi:hypothetical protein